MKEIWKDIEDFPNYQVSNFGRIKSKERTVILENGRTKVVKSKILKPCLRTLGKNGNYYRITLYNNKNPKTINIHRIVAKSFVENPKNYNIINHIDGNKFNNRADNLEWCTQQHNVKESYRLGLQGPNNRHSFPKGMKPHNITRVSQYDLNGNFIKTYDSVLEATLVFVDKRTSNISLCLNGKTKTAYGYIWKYADK